jgi:hypothetical protein
VEARRFAVGGRGASPLPSGLVLPVLRRDLVGIAGVWGFGGIGGGRGRSFRVDVDDWGTLSGCLSSSWMGIDGDLTLVCVSRNAAGDENSAGCP